jgi:glycosyltransferase involved in cell wall biosynthesis
VIQYIIRGFCNSCDAVTTPAQGMADRLNEMGITKPVSVIPNGVDTLPYEKPRAEEFRSVHGWNDDKLLLFAGRLNGEKNLSFLLQSFAFVRQSVRDARLLLVGDGPYRSKLKALTVNLGIERYVHFCGWVTQAQVPVYYQAADLFVMPSVTEVNPLCLGEALSMGTPIVAVDTFAARERLCDGKDSILTSHDLTEFSSAIVCLLEDPARRQRMSRYALTNAETFSLSMQVDALLACYEQVLAMRNPFYGSL